MSDLVLRGICKSFGDSVAVRDLSLQVDQGEFVAILGPSGCGKTTTLRMIAGFERPDRGSILIGGRDMTDVPPRRRDIGVVFQNYALFPHLTVFRNVAFGLEMRRLPGHEVRAAVEEALALVRLGALAERLPRQLSGGQQQRVALARALAVRPRLLLLDEPLSNLDAKLRDEMREEIRRIQRQTGITALFVTHDQAEAFALADRVAVMEGGQLQQIADPTTIYERPANAVVMRFIGQSNCLDGTVTSAEGTALRVQAGSGLIMRGRGEGLTAGERCQVFIKHERLAVARERCDADNVFAGRVAEKLYLGDASRYAIALDGDVVLRVMVPVAPGSPRFDVGTAVFVSWAAADTQVFAS